MQYNLWDTETSNYFGQFEDEKQVLTLVQTLVDHYGDRYAEDLGLGRVTDEGEILAPLSGAALVARVNEVLRECQGDSERRGVLIASPVQVRRTVMSIEPVMAAASRVAGRAVRRLTDAGQRRIQKG